MQNDSRVSIFGAITTNISSEQTILVTRIDTEKLECVECSRYSVFHEWTVDCSVVQSHFHQKFYV